MTLEIVDESALGRRSDVRGYTVNRSSQRVHLRDPYERCNTDDALDLVKVRNREEVNVALGGRRGYACKWCFPPPTSAQEVEALRMPEEGEPGGEGEGVEGDE